MRQAAGSQHLWRALSVPNQAAGGACSCRGGCRVQSPCMPSCKVQRCLHVRKAA